MHPEFVSHRRQGDAECLNGVERISEVERKLVVGATSKLQHDVIICKQRLDQSHLGY